MDKMRLVAKVRAGREMLDAAVATTRPGGGSGSGTSAASRAASMRNMMRFPAPLAFA